LNCASGEGDEEESEGKLRGKAAKRAQSRKRAKGNVEIIDLLTARWDREDEFRNKEAEDRKEEVPPPPLSHFLKLLQAELILHGVEVCVLQKGGRGGGVK
jgi:hypothetical protein